MAAAASKATARFTRPPLVTASGSDYFNCIVYGRPGVGKTTFAATGPPPILILDADQGLLALRDPDPAFAEKVGLHPDQTYFEPIRSLDDIRAQIRRIDEETHASPGWWGTVVLDNLTELQRVLLTDLLRRSERSIPAIQDWGVILLQVQAIVRALRNLPVHTVFIAHERQDDSGIGPALSGRIAEELPGYVDLMARLVCIEKEDGAGDKKVTRVIRRLRCREQLGTPAVEAKCRGRRLGDWEEPHLSRLIAKSHHQTP